MASPTNVYVDPAIAANSGTGTIGDPYGDLQFALNTKARDTTNGDQFNVKAGTSEILASALTLATYGTPTATAPLIIRGYTAAANDGGIGVVSGNGSVACFTGSPVHTKLVNMRWTNTGSNVVVTLGTGALVLACEVDTSTGGGITAASGGVIVNNYIHNTTGSGISSNCFVYGNTLRNETNDFVQAINVTGGGALFNIIDIDGASHGILINSSFVLAMFNSIYSNGGTGNGIRNNNTAHTSLALLNNTVEGFSGVGGIGFLLAGQNIDISGYNLAYNNTTNYSITGDVNVSLGGNDAAGASPFTNAGSDDFDPIAGLLALYPSYPTAWNNYASTQQNLIRMAAQYAAGVGGGGPIFGGMVVR